jgi:hypothetical protein
VNPNDNFSKLHLQLQFTNGEYPMYKKLPRTLTLSISALTLCLLSACGGGGAGSSASQATITGNVTKGPTAGASICAFVVNSDGSKGTSLGCVTSKVDSSFSLSTSYSGDVLLEASGGTYTDEATGFTVNLSTPLQVIVNAQTGKSTQAQITPLTTLGFNQLKNSGVVNAVNYKSALVALAAALKAKGVLPVSSATNLLEDIPVVAGANTNAYGQALIGVARLMNAGTSLISIVSSVNATSTMTRLATASSAGLSNAQAQLVLMGNAVATMSSSAPLCSTDRDMAWSPVLGSMIYGTYRPSAAVSYLPSIEYGMGTTYNASTDAAIGSMCYATQIAYFNVATDLMPISISLSGVPVPPVLPPYTPTAILGTTNTIVNITTMSGSLKTTLNVTDIRCLSERTDYVISDWGFAQPPPATTTTPVLKMATYYRLITETEVVPANANAGSTCTPSNPGEVCLNSAPIPGGPFGQTNGLCWAQQYKTENFVWRY